MPLRQLGPWKVIESNYSFSEKYWPLLSDRIKVLYGTQEIKESEQTQIVLKECFSYFCSEFKTLLNKKKKASFFIFVHYIHEDSIEIYRQRLAGNNIPVNDKDFAGTRRVMKCILEQGCGIDLIGHPFFFREICENINDYITHLEELLYLGCKAFEMSEYIAKSILFPHSIGIQVLDDELTTFIYPPFNSLFEFYGADYHSHKSSVVISDCIFEFKQILEKEVKISLDDLSGFFGNQLKQKRYRWGVFNLEELIAELNTEFGYSIKSLTQLYSGLIITKDNVITFEESLFKTQDERRYMYRPILKYKIDNQTYFICGANKWSESITQLTTNCFPFGQSPKEWDEFPPLKEFFKRIKNSHDKVLENPAIEIIKKENLKYDRNVKYLRRENNQNISIIKANVGEIDIFFLDERGCVIYLLECKHNRARFEYNNWRRDIDAFRKSYEKQLSNKNKWIDEHKIEVLEHFEVIYNVKINEKEKYSVFPMFIINAPTLYMYDSQYEVFTLTDLEHFFNGTHITHKFEGEFNGKTVILEKPYFQNAEALFI